MWNLLCPGHGLHIVQGRSCNKCLSVEKRFAKLQRPHLPAPSPLLLGHSSLPFARLQTLKTLQFPRGSFHQALWPSAFAVPALQPALCLHIALLLEHSSLSCHQALWPSAFAVPGLQPALWLHIPRGSFHQAPGPQRSSIAACPLPAHSPSC